MQAEQVLALQPPCFCRHALQAYPAAIPSGACKTHSGSSSAATNMVGTPYRLVQRSCCTAASVAAASNVSAVGRGCGGISVRAGELAGYP